MNDEISITVPDLEDLGPAMRACTEMQRKFVVAYFHCGGNRTRAAEAAGYAAVDGNHKQSAYQVWQKPHVQAAVREYAEKHLLGDMLPIAWHAWREIVMDASHKDRSKMVLAVLERTGFHAITQHNVNVRHSDDRLATVREIVRLAKATGQDARMLLGAATDVTDAEFEIIEREILQIEHKPREVTEADIFGGSDDHTGDD